MNKLKIFSIFLFLIILILIINRLHEGTGGWNGKDIDSLLGKPAAEATIDDMKNHSKSEYIQMFYAAEAPPPNSLDGEYKGKMMRVGFLFFLTRFFEVYIYGPPGEWVGKGLYPCPEAQCPGYNLFEVKNESGQKEIIKARPMYNYIAKSNLDDKNSYYVDYHKKNSGLVYFLTDEIRKINDTLYIGLGYLKFPFGSMNHSPFFLYGKPQKLSGNVKK